jgi:plastocyanin
MRSLLILSLTVLPGVAGGETIKGVVALVSADLRQARKPDAAGAVVWLEPIGTVSQTPASPPKPTAVSQRNLTFVPHVTAIHIGTAVDFPNNDPIFHNVFSNFDGQVFDLQLYAPRTARRVVFRRSGIVRVFCNIHDTMSAVIAVLPTPYFAVTDGTGRFDIQAPAGDYRLQFWHERARPDVLAGLARRVTVGEAPVVLPETQITMSTQPQPPHKDKYGREYAQKHEDRVFYQGARR